MHNALTDALLCQASYTSPLHCTLPLMIWVTFMYSLTNRFSSYYFFQYLNPRCCLQHLQIVQQGFTQDSNLLPTVCINKPCLEINPLPIRLMQQPPPQDSPLTAMHPLLALGVISLISFSLILPARTVLKH